MTESVTTGLTREQRQYLEALGIPVWRERHAVDEEAAIAQAVAVPTTEAESPPRPPLGEETLAAWKRLEQQVRECTACELYKTRTQAVFGVGDRQADWLIVGEAPGRDEDAQGEPFVGRAGKLLNAMLAALDFAREDVYIANILKSRPPNNRDPKSEEVSACEPYLKQQIALLEPKIILAVGRIAAQNLLKTDTPISKLRGQRHEYPASDESPAVPLIVTYHPAYLLRSPADKRKAWQDLLLARRVYREVVAA